MTVLFASRAVCFKLVKAVVLLVNATINARFPLIQLQVGVAAPLAIRYAGTVASPIIAQNNVAIVGQIFGLIRDHVR